jgi:hypothetical protein
MQPQTPHAAATVTLPATRPQTAPPRLQELLLQQQQVVQARRPQQLQGHSREPVARMVARLWVLRLVV